MNCWHMMHLVFLNRYFFPNCCRDFLVLKVDLRHRTVFYPCSFLNINEKKGLIQNKKIQFLLLIVTMAEQDPEPELLEMVSL